MANADSSGARRAPSPRTEAKRLGEKRYTTGLPCLQGHIAERLTINGSCCICARAAHLQRYRDNPAADLARQKAYREAHPERLEAQRAKTRELHPERAIRAAYLATEASLRSAAQQQGSATYVSTRQCAHGHAPIRFTGDRKCMECNRIACNARTPEAVRLAKAERARQRAEDKAQRSAAYRKVTEARQAALDSGSVTYQGKACPHGHDGLRRAKSGCCIGCEKEESVSAAKKAYDKAYLAANYERILERSRKHHAAHPEQRMAQARQWAKDNPEKRKAIAMAYKSRRRQQEEGGDTTAVLYAWEKAAKKVCHWCGCKCPKTYHVDHYQPLSKGGKHEVANLVIACPNCNLRKSAKDPFEFAASMGRLF